MKREEFIEWLRNSTSFENDGLGLDNWRELMNYAEYIWDELTVNENSVTFNWEEWYWDGRDYRTSEYTFDEFKDRYNNYSLKY